MEARAICKAQFLILKELPASQLQASNGSGEQPNRSLSPSFALWPCRQCKCWMDARELLFLVYNGTILRADPGFVGFEA